MARATSPSSTLPSSNSTQSRNQVPSTGSKRASRRLEAATRSRSSVSSLLEELGVQHRHIVAGRPQTNGCVERVHQTILEECWKPTFARHLMPHITGLREELRRYLHDYNTDRAHTGRWTRGRTPEQVIAKAKMWAR
jgi:transposase InsO family protein